MNGGKKSGKLHVFGAGGSSTGTSVRSIPRSEGLQTGCRTDRMKEIAGAIAEGARAFLTAEYKILVIFVAVLFVLIGIGVGSWVTAICFVVGALFSTIAGYCGMTVATKANVRTANAAKEGGMNKALSIAFSGGAVWVCVLQVLAHWCQRVYIITKNVDVLSGFSLVLLPSHCLHVLVVESIQRQLT